MASFHVGIWWQYLLWNLAGFGVALVVDSFVEWAVHRWIMHKRNPILPYGYKHTTSHHATFKSDLTYMALNAEMLEHGVAFTWREFVLFPLLCSAIYIPAELLLRRPIYLGCMAAVFLGLIAFNVLHFRFHVPQGGWLERTRAFRLLNRHHLLHHERMNRNLNVVFPLADVIMRTLVMEPADPKRTIPL